MGVLTTYFNTVSSEQFKKEWEEVVGNLPKSEGPKVSDILYEWRHHYGYCKQVNKIADNIKNSEALGHYQGLSF